MPGLEGQEQASASSDLTKPDCADHRQEANSAVVQCLNAGVASLPGYIELSDIILVLVPLVEHKERSGEICGFGTWRGRGWCRLEFMAAVLSPSPTRVMLVEGAEVRPHFISFAEALHSLPPGMGHFSCCARGHDFGQGPVPCDKIKIRSVLTTLLEAKVALLHQQTRWFEMRYHIAAEHWFFRGLEGHAEDSPPNTEGAGAAQEIQRATSFTSVAKRRGWVEATERLAALKDVLCWREEDGGEAERRESRRTGASLLGWAIVADALPIVLELLMDPQVRTRDVNRVLAQDSTALSIRKKMTPLMIAMSVARPEVVAALLEARANPQARDANEFGALERV